MRSRKHKNPASFQKKISDGMKRYWARRKAQEAAAKEPDLGPPSSLYGLELAIIEAERRKAALAQAQQQQRDGRS